MTTTPDAGPTPPAPRRPRSRMAGLLVVVIALGALALLYALNPGLRARAFDAIIAIFQRPPDIAPNPRESNEALALMNQAAELMWQQKWNEANAIYQRLHEMHPDAQDVWYGLALCRHNLGEYEGAIEANLRAADYPPLAPGANYHLAGEYAQTGRTDDAFAALHLALQLGFRDVGKLANDPTLAALRDDPRYSVPEAPQQLTFTLSSGRPLRYTLVLPQNFDEAATYPALLAFTGSSQDRATTDYGLDRFWGMQASLRGWIVVCPVSPGGQGYFGGDAYRLLPELLDEIRSRYHLEGGKYHLAGFSNGGTACFNIATAFPDYFQSLTAFPLYELTPDAAGHLDALSGMKVRLLYGARDEGPSAGASRDAYERLTALGVDATLTELPDDGHVPLSLMGDNLMKRLDMLRPGMTVAPDATPRPEG